MKRRDSMLLLIVAPLILLALLTVFAIELSDTQAKSQSDVKARVHERGVLAAALIDSLFGTVQAQAPQDARIYGGRTVSRRTMDANRRTDQYLVLLAPSGRVLAYSRGFTPQARAALPGSAALALVRSGHPYGLGNVLPYGATGVVDLAIPFPTAHGPRILLTGLAPASLAAFESADLRKIPGVTGSHNYLLDGNDTVLASTNPARPAGYRFGTRAQVSALKRTAGDTNGRYYDQVPIADSTERIVLSAPNGPLFASVSGLRMWIPWLIFIAFALVAIVALVLGRRVIRAADEVRGANAHLELLNRELAGANASLEGRAAELARSNDELEQFASIASHDLQEPLRKVRTFTQQLRVTDAEHLSEKGSDYLDRANAAAERMQKLIEDLLRYSRVATHARPFAPVDLGQVAEAVLQDLELQIAASGARVRLEQLPTLDADELQMHQLLQNLISNALKFVRDDVVPEVVIGAAVTNDHAIITVRDNGIGFDPQYAGRIFRVFERLHGRGRYPGTGIGLALCRKIVERHHGEISAAGESGVGATFTVTLPLRQPEQTESDAYKGNGARSEWEVHVRA